MKTIKELEAETYNHNELARKFTLNEIRLFRVETLKEVLELIDELPYLDNDGEVLKYIKELKARITG